MKIIDVKTTVLFQPFEEAISDAARSIQGRDILIVEIVTDQDVTGHGFLTGLGVAHGSEIKVIDEIINKGLKPMIIGENALSIEKLWHTMYHGTTRYGRKGAAVRAISGIDIALWDAVGKRAGMPVRRLLGGYADRVKVYASGGFYWEKNDVEHLLEEVREYLHQGFTAVKIKVGRDIRSDIKRAEAVRAAIGEETDLLLDANEAWDLSTALKFLNAVRDLNIYWLEEPLKPDDTDGYVSLTRKSVVPIVAGENEYTKWGFKDLIARKAVNIVQPDVTRVGGVTEWIKIAAVSQAWNISCVPHAVQEIHVSLVSAVSNSPMMEYFTADHYLQRFISDVFCEPSSIRSVRDGYVYPPDKPGLGLEMDRDLVEKYRVG